ncbi:hypothetical protein BDZ90DRAFT_88094 [Jaminaea rosea]|uniref:Uncharacterized protein n=1 Tax=Jaminaea rosea TaxID=1569628 RepID=A0A316UJ43_9BASI|nr:hypothetical protein BDZ90DRAFT_88094 [Jaminaea rosea]PWN24888.1 hypothetical protein BDZ90DRAFT_88094 [Jaminaea rosea]
MQSEWTDVLASLRHIHSRATLGKDCGIVITNRSWRVLEQEMGEGGVRVVVKLPQPPVTEQPDSRRVMLYSTHTLRHSREMWTKDAAGFSREFGSANKATSTVIVGGNFNFLASRRLPVRSALVRAPSAATTAAAIAATASLIPTAASTAANAQPDRITLGPDGGLIFVPQFVLDQCAAADADGQSSRRLNLVGGYRVLTPTRPEHPRLNGKTGGLIVGANSSLSSLPQTTRIHVSADCCSGESAHRLRGCLVLHKRAPQSKVRSGPR